MLNFICFKFSDENISKIVELKKIENNIPTTFENCKIRLIIKVFVRRPKTCNVHRILKWVPKKKAGKHFTNSRLFMNIVKHFTRWIVSKA